MKKVKFIKQCPCMIKGRRRFFEVGDIYQADDKDADWMINCGYAKGHIGGKIEVEAKAAQPVKENKSVEKPTKKRGRKKAE